jgi:hypothetical protein
MHLAGNYMTLDNERRLFWQAPGSLKSPSEIIIATRAICKLPNITPEQYFKRAGFDSADGDLFSPTFASNSFLAF